MKSSQPTAPCEIRRRCSSLVIDATPHQEPKLSENGWQELYKAAILELDPMQLQDRVKAAESAISARASLGVQISRDERRGMDDALSALRMLKRGRAC